MSDPATPPPIPAVAPRSGMATASMVCGFLTIPTCLATALPAIILGHIVLSQSDRSQVASRKAATLGLIFGYGSIVLIPVIAAVAGLLAPLVIRQRNQANQAVMLNQMRQIGLALMTYQIERGTDEEPYPTDLSQLDSTGFTTNIDELLSLRGNHTGTWWYFSTANPDNDSSPLLISPEIDGKVGILSVDVSVRLRPRDEAMNLIQSETEMPLQIPPPPPPGK